MYAIRSYYGDEPEAKNGSFNDDSWRKLNLPHDWSIEQKYTSENTSGSTGFLPAGIGWYRKTFAVETTDQNKIISIEFDGVYKNAEVWINGHYLGKRPYGYSVFGYNLSPYLKYGANNTIAVRVDHSVVADARWYPGSGIYRDVRLVTTSACYIPQFGAWIETPVANAAKAEVAVFAVVRNETGHARNVSVRTDIYDAQNRLVGSTRKNMKSTFSDTIKMKMALQKPQLWQIESPVMYRA